MSIWGTRKSLLTPETIWNGAITNYEFKHYSLPTVERLSQKGMTVAWLRAQPTDMTFAPNSKEQCVHGRMFRRVLGDHAFEVDFDTVDYIDWRDKAVTASLTTWGSRYQRATLAYIGNRDGDDESGEPNLNGHITRDEALRLARELSGRN